MTTLLKSELPFPCRRGKVRDVYDIGDVAGVPALLIVASDRISAFDVIMPDPIPGKGAILTAISRFWFDHLKAASLNHLITADVGQFPSMLKPYSALLRGRSMLVKKTTVVPIECVARGYLAGSAWKEYRECGAVGGAALPPGLRQCEKLPEPIFTPATKEQSGHDQNIDFGEAQRRVGTATASALRSRTLSLYREAADYAERRGILIADTKFEFGHLPADGDRGTAAGELILIDEVLTPDSSRFWDAGEYAPGRDQPSLDKQFLRDWLASQAWDKNPPAPRLPIEVIDGTLSRYQRAMRRLIEMPATGQAATLMTEAQTLHPRILVVDDNQDVCRSLTRILKHLGYDGQYAASGAEALTKVSEQIPDLMILDIMMPGMDGMEVLDRLKSDVRTRAFPVVMFSAITDDESRQRALRLGAVDYWVKASVNFTELGTRLRKLLDSVQPN